MFCGKLYGVVSTLYNTDVFVLQSNDNLIAIVKAKFIDKPTDV